MTAYDVETRPLFALIAAGCAALLLISAAACFSDDPVATDTECQSFEASVTVEIRDFAFEPAVACVEQGGTVTWVNVGDESHTSTGAGSGPLWDSGLLGDDEEFTRTFDESGEFDYLCLPHPFMQGVVIVE